VVAAVVSVVAAVVAACVVTVVAAWVVPVVAAWVVAASVVATVVTAALLNVALLISRMPTLSRVLRSIARMTDRCVATCVLLEALILRWCVDGNEILCNRRLSSVPNASC